jgi:hypothetical protein
MINLTEQQLIRLSKILWDRLLANPSFHYDAFEGESFTDVVISAANEAGLAEI